jgi:hypothetical protein
METSLCGREWGACLRAALLTLILFTFKNFHDERRSWGGGDVLTRCAALARVLGDVATDSGKSGVILERKQATRETLEPARSMTVGGSLVKVDWPGRAPNHPVIARESSCERRELNPHASYGART